MKQIIGAVFLLFLSIQSFSQGMNDTWLLGNDPGWSNLGRFIFDDTSYQYLPEQRKMSFKGTQATISDLQGNFLMSSNGIWIANSINDTMQNGQDLNPGWDVNTHPNGLLIPYGNIFLPYPADSSKFVLIHEVKTNQFSIDPTRIYQTIIDITLDNGLGAVIQKNDSILEDTLSLGLAASRHANGRDWWIIAITDGNPEIYKMLLTPNGISNITSQIINYNPNTWGNLSQLTFSPNGTKLIYSSGVNQSASGEILLLDFDRCSGIFSNEQIVSLSTGNFLWGLAFSPTGEYAYACNSGYIFQINVNTLNIDTVAIYDGFISGLPPNCCATTFFNMYLAANGKIYITSGNGVQHIHEMNNPDIGGIGCNVQQHNISFTNFFHLRSVPNHPNYYLGALLGSSCDTLGLGIKENDHKFNFSVSPNPNDGNFKISYLLPQNENGKLEIFDLNGKIIYSQVLPPWSTMQVIKLKNISSGLYNCVITSAGKRTFQKLAIVSE